MSHYLVTGGTGVVGSALVEKLSGEGESITALVRDRSKGERMLSTFGAVSIVEGDLARAPELLADSPAIDFIIHAASPTRSSFFTEHPVDTIEAIVEGANAMLELARTASVTSMLYVSTMEVYGVPPEGHTLVESDQFYVDPTRPRSSYPVAKRVAEALCCAYASQYGTPVRIARLAQVIGHRLLPEDDRAVAQFARAASAGHPIELMTDGSAEQTLISMEDAVDGLLTVLLAGTDGEMYNVANEDAFCSVKELAETTAELASGQRSQVLTDVGESAGRYPPNRSVRLSTAKLRGLGWEPKQDLRTALQILMASLSS